MSSKENKKSLVLVIGSTLLAIPIAIVAWPLLLVSFSVSSLINKIKNVSKHGKPNNYDVYKVTQMIKKGVTKVKYPKNLNKFATTYKKALQIGELCNEFKTIFFNMTMDTYGDDIKKINMLDEKVTKLADELEKELDSISKELSVDTIEVDSLDKAQPVMDIIHTYDTLCKKYFADVHKDDWAYYEPSTGKYIAEKIPEEIDTVLSGTVDYRYFGINLRRIANKADDAFKQIKITYNAKIGGAKVIEEGLIVNLTTPDILFESIYNDLETGDFDTSDYIHN